MGNIRIIGPRNSGKKTYLAGLAYWSQNKGARGGKVFEIEPLNGVTKELATKARNLILRGTSFEPTVVTDVKALTSYSFQIRVNQRFRKPKRINLGAKDYPGEIFEQLGSGFKNRSRGQFMEDCLGKKDVEGCLILLTDWTAGKDGLYSNAFSGFLQFMDKYERFKDLRVAIAMSKCERGELWPGRLEPEIDIFQNHLPDTPKLLRSRIEKDNLKFFALSTFGVLDRNDPRPNRTELVRTGVRAVLRDTRDNRWKPYGMIDPLYWLSTGKYKEFRY